MQYVIIVINVIQLINQHALPFPWLPQHVFITHKTCTARNTKIRPYLVKHTFALIWQRTS